MSHGSPLITSDNVDLTSCDREQIQIPGSIQSHGVLLVLNEPELSIVQVSENSSQILGIPPHQLLHSSFRDLLDDQQFAYWNQDLLPNLSAAPLYLAPLKLRDHKYDLEGSVHRYDDVLILQLERRADVARPVDRYASALLQLAELQSAPTFDFYARAARAVREHTGYDRVVVYKFLSDGSGEVVGENKHDDLISWLGLRYPASDIPQQARELYLRSWIRIIADVEDSPARLIPPINPVSGRPLDMSYCVLRSISPIHLQYLRNIGTRASMSLSLVSDNKLWGLIACHHRSQKCPTIEARIACEFLAQSLSLQVASKEAAIRQSYLSELRLNLSQSFGPRVTDVTSANLLDLLQSLSTSFGSHGMAIVSSVDIITSGVTPDTDQIQAMLPWLRDLSRDQSLDKKLDGYVLTTNRLFELYPPAKAFQKIASGLLAIEVGQHRIEWLLWFRPEVVQIISWAGDPRKIIQSYDQTGQVRLSPRGSFALWQEEHAGSSEPWLDEEAKIARELRLTIVEAALGQALRNSEATARSILGNASQGILTVNRKGLIVDVNPMVEKLFGYDRIELVGNTVEVLLPDALRSRHISHRADYVSRPYTREMGQGMDLLALRKDGTQFPVEISLSFVKEYEDGGLSMAFISDITARKKAIAERETLIAELQKALAQQTVLLQEVHHRVKNNLQVISSLLHMQARTVSDSKAKEALNESQRRVLAMALIHQYLYGGKQLDHIDFAEYIRSLTGQLFSYYAESAPNITSHLQLSPVLMTIDQALPCGLVLNELVTNALKYAYPNGLAGVVSVQLEETAHNSIKLTVSDRGVGFPKGFDWKNSPSMGLAIVQVLAKQIGADLELKDFDGTTFVLTLPKSDKDAQNG